jgi:hypothetical protein
MEPLPREAEALLAVAPDDFVRERQALAKALRTDGRREDAQLVAGLKKPAPVVLAVNRAARDRPEAARGAVRAAEQVAKTQLASDPDAYRDALAELARSVDLLEEVALAHLARGGKPPSEAASRRLRDLLRNAVADEDARTELARGMLRDEPETAGFGALAGVTPSARPRSRSRGTKAEDTRRKRAAEKQRERERALRAELADAERALDGARRAERDAERARKTAERKVESLRERLTSLRDNGD